MDQKADFDRFSVAFWSTFFVYDLWETSGKPMRTWNLLRTTWRFPRGFWRKPREKRQTKMLRIKKRRFGRYSIRL